ncbi:MAG: hypothetical protein MUE81_24340 [Thermoflexibacter sp.]|nr:hypothetical protein [Thermoflexibacter sp.]
MEKLVRASPNQCVCQRSQASLTRERQRDHSKAVWGKIGHSECVDRAIGRLQTSRNSRFAW